MFYIEIQLNYAVIICITGSHEHYNQKLVPCSADGICVFRSDIRKASQNPTMEDIACLQTNKPVKTHVVSEFTWYYKAFSTLPVNEKTPVRTENCHHEDQDFDRSCDQISQS